MDNVKFECDQKCLVNAGDNYYSEKTRANFNEKLVKNYLIKLPYGFSLHFAVVYIKLTKLVTWII